MSEVRKFVLQPPRGTEDGFVEAIQFFEPKISVFRVVVAEFVDDSGMYLSDMLAGLRSLPTATETVDTGQLVRPPGKYWAFQGSVSDELLALIRKWARPLSRIEVMPGFVGKAANDCWWA